MSDATVGPVSTPNLGKKVTLPPSAVGKTAIGLGVATVVWGLFFPFVVQMIARYLQRGGTMPFRFPIGMGSAILEILLAVGAISTGIIALRRGERSWALTSAFILACLIGGLWIAFALGEVLLPH